MPDYLERVVLGGARTSTPGKPPPAAPPRMPGVSQPWFPPVETLDIIDAEAHPSVGSSGLPMTTLSAMPANATPPQPSPEALAPGASKGEQTPSGPSAPAESSAASPAPMPHPPSALGDPTSSEAAAIIRAPTALRPMLDNVQNSPSQETLAARSAANAAPESSANLTPPLPSTPSAERRRPMVESQPAPKDASVAASVQPASVRRSTPAVVDLMGAQQTVTRSPLTGEVEHEREPPGPPRRAEVVLPPDTRTEEAGDPVRARQIEADLRTTPEVERHRTTPAPPLQQLGASPPNPWPTPAQQVPAVSISTGADGRQSRITIGRIDVQVNNQPPAPPSAPPPPGTSPIAADVLEGRFLSRFALKL
jgi:hypothetical protein